MNWKLIHSETAKRFAKYGFFFFLVKGLLWLIVPALIAFFYGFE